MRLNANVLSVITLLLCLTSPPSHADSLLATLNDWIAGTSTGNQATNAGFKGGVTADAGKSFATMFDDSQTLDVLFDIRVAPEHIGKTGSLYLVARYNNDWFMKDSNGQWQSWDYQLTSLVSTAGPRPLQALESLKVAEQLKGLTGKIEVYAGYKIDDDIHYNAKPFSFSVQKKEKPTPVVPVNVTPIADAGVDKDLNELTQITLDGSKSRDPDGSIVKYLWEQISGLPVYKVYDANTAKATITTPEVRTTEELQFKLTVTDNQGASTSSFVKVTVLNVEVALLPEPTCIAPQVLQNGVCVTPTPTCAAPQILENGGCVDPNPSPITKSISGFVLSGSETAARRARSISNTGITVTAYAPNGSVIGSTMANADDSFSINVSDVNLGASEQDVEDGSSYRYRN